MDHSPGFLKLVAEAKKHVNEISVAEARAKLATHPKVVLIDVREDHEWAAGHAVEAVHLGKGILERDLEKLYPDAGTEIIMYCGGGYRSAPAQGTPVICSGCGQPTTVPFEPRGDRPVFCRDCYQARKGSSGGGGGAARGRGRY